MKRAKVLTPSEVKRLLRIASTTKHGERNKLIVMFSYLAGLRACEIASLRVGDVIDTNGTSRTEVFLDSTQTKGNQRQCILLNAVLRRQVTNYLDSSRKSTSTLEPLFQSQKGSFFSSQTIQNLFRSLYAAAGIEHASSHSGRRTFITNLSERGVSTRVIQELARHSSMATTQRYIDVSVDKLRNAVDLIGI